VVICLQGGANDLHMIQLMPLPTHRLLLHQNPELFNLSDAGLPGCPAKGAIKQASVCNILVVLRKTSETRDRVLLLITKFRGKVLC